MKFWDLSWILILGTIGSERVNIVLYHKVVFNTVEWCWTNCAKFFTGEYKKATPKYTNETHRFTEVQRNLTAKNVEEVCWCTAVDDLGI